MRTQVFFFNTLVLFGCSGSGPSDKEQGSDALVDSTYIRLAEEVRQEAHRSWKACKQHA